MPDPTPTPPKKPRAKPGFISQSLADAIKKGLDCAREAAKPEVNPALVARDWPAEAQARLVASNAHCAALGQQIKDARTGKKQRTEAEESALAALLKALGPILKGARRLPQSAAAERAAYGVGLSLPNAATRDLLGLARSVKAQLTSLDGAPPKAKLKGVLPAEIAAIAGLADAYEGADWAQGDAQQRAATLLAQLKKEIDEVLNPLVRDLQGAADQAYTHRDPVNAAQRQAFALQPDRPFTA